ncbi:bestrophin family protein [Sediminibacterium ginsengisoli]|uniref:Putative membrane protein n=1 Tax=Sediminibacterium ginsengisoli TaxID=413434 RepID=A0A1T4L175_9BACT|nr:bestrophin family ion channel [Sediminibacterium ginsengisoli]SJZ48465.1 putative membrane protein [Sediminibacterium ginsengisoli]
MISYNPKEWLRFIFRFHRADTIRKLFPLIVAICLYSWLITFVELEYLPASITNFTKNIPTMHSLLGFAISMLLVFRTNTAYDRWWEGRKLWGSLVNNSRNLALKMNSLLPVDDQKNRSFFRKSIALFASELKQHLQNEKTRLALDDNPHPEIQGFDTSKHIPAQIVALMMTKVNLLHRDGQINGYQLMMLNGELQSFMDVCGACERIKNTPIPYSYSVFIKKFVFFYVITLPLGFAHTFSYFSIPIVAFIFYVLASLELIAEEIEDPFGKDENDLPMKKMSDNIARNVQEILH